MRARGYGQVAHIMALLDRHTQRQIKTEIFRQYEIKKLQLYMVRSLKHSCQNRTIHDTYYTIQYDKETIRYLSQGESKMTKYHTIQLRYHTYPSERIQCTIIFEVKNRLKKIFMEI